MTMMNAAGPAKYHSFMVQFHVDGDAVTIKTASHNLLKFAEVMSSSLTLSNCNCRTTHSNQRMPSRSREQQPPSILVAKERTELATYAGREKIFLL